MTLVDRVKNILLTPKTEWPKIAGETETTQSIFVNYVAILAAIGPIAMAISIMAFGGLIGIGAAIVSYIIAFVSIIVLTWIADALAPTFGGTKNFVQALKLVAYSYTAVWVAGIFHLLPILGRIIMVIAGIYSLYTFYLGAPTLGKCTADKAVGYTVVVVICVIVLWVLLGVVLMAGMFGGMGMAGMSAGMWR
jgi:Yip1 domain